MPQAHQSLTIEIAKKLAETLVSIADRFPLNFLTERDFYPLIHTFLSERVPNVTSEHGVREGQIDFRTGGTNPGLIELAVAPREFGDRNRAELQMPGFSTAPQLYASQNRPELKKLFQVEVRYANRYLFLIDLRGKYEFDELVSKYESEARKIKGKTGAVSIIYARHNFCDRFVLSQV